MIIVIFFLLILAFVMFLGMGEVPFAVAIAVTIAFLAVIGGVWWGGAMLVTMFVTMFEGIYSMFGVGFFLMDGILLWIVLGVFAVLALASIESERPGFCTAMVVGALLVLQFYSKYHPFTFAMQRPMDAIVLAAVYFAVATGWICVKWMSHVYLVGRKFDGIKDGIKKEFVEGANGLNGHMYREYLTTDGALTDEGKTRLYVIAAGQLHERRLPLQVNQHKSDLYMWWLCWPLSMLWTAINDPVKRLWWFVYDNIGSMLQRISDRAFKLD